VLNQRQVQEQSEPKVERIKRKDNEIIVNGKSYFINVKKFTEFFKAFGIRRTRYGVSPLAVIAYVKEILSVSNDEAKEFLNTKV